MREAQSTLRWIADACDGDARDAARHIPVLEAIEDYEIFHGEKTVCQDGLIGMQD